jgi:hypothetical protein
MTRHTSALIVGLVVTLYASTAAARTVRLNRVWGGNSGKTIVAIHGHANCTESGGTRYDARCGSLSYGYWLNSKNDGGDDHDLLGEASSKCTSSGCSMSCSSTDGCSTLVYSGSWSTSEVFVIRYNGVDQAMWYATNDVANCLVDLRQGSNSTGCNPNYFKRTSVYLIGHSEGGTIIDRICSNPTWYGGLCASGGMIVGYPKVLAGALAGSKAASALYGVDGASNFCTSLVSWLASWALKGPGAQSLTRGTVIGEARNGKAGKSGRWIYKVTTPGGSGSCNNNWKDSIKESVNDSALGTLCGCIGYSSSDDTDGICWQYDSDPTANPSTSNGGKYRAEYTGNYWHWVRSWANHSHNRNDAYVRKYGFQNYNGCKSISPGTCIGQYGP